MKRRDGESESMPERDPPALCPSNPDARCWPIQVLVTDWPDSLSAAILTAPHCLWKLGYTDIPVSLLLKLSIHGVNPDYINTLKARGLDLTLEQMIKMKIHNII